MSQQPAWLQGPPTARNQDFMHRRRRRVRSLNDNGALSLASVPLTLASMGMLYLTASSGGF